MKRFFGLNLALVLVLLVPVTASAQKDSKYTREASKYIGLAMTKSERADRVQLYQNALVHLREGMVQDAQNAKVWLLAGTVLAGIGELQEANEAFAKAQQMHAAYAEEIEVERESAWVEAFNVGIEAMDQRDYAGAIRALEGAQLIYDRRPEALMNLGALYANESQLDKAEKAFEAAIATTKGPVFEKLDEDGKAQWVRFREMAQMNIAQMIAGQGVAAFEAERFDDAANQFRRATEVNPHARDFWFNLTQAYWAQASSLEDKLEEDSTDVAAKQGLLKLYPQVIELARKTREMDPANPLLFIIEARSERMIGEYTGGAVALKAGHDKALAMLEAHEALPVEVLDIMLSSDETGATIRGKVKNRKLADGTDVTVRFTLYGIDGRVLGEQDVVVKAGAAEAETAFEVKSDATADIAGWRYSVRS